LDIMADAAPSRKPHSSAFKQQKLKAWQPILTPGWVIGTFFVVGVPFVIIGVVILIASGDVQEVRIPYSEDAKCSKFEKEDEACEYKNCAQQQRTCTVDFTVEADMKGDVYVYYELENFYQNHRRYVKSRADTQLRGDNSALPDNNGDMEPSIAVCDPESSQFTRMHAKFFKDGTMTSENFDCNAATDYSTDEYTKNCMQLYYYPCGLIALSKFNDKFRLTDSAKNPVKWKNDKIAWESDIESKFKYPRNSCNWLKDNCNNIVECGKKDGQASDDGTPEMTTQCVTSISPDKKPVYGVCKEEKSPVMTVAFAPPVMTEAVSVQTGQAFTKFKGGGKGYYCWHDVRDPDFVVWMRTAGLPTFKKLHRIIPEDVGMKKGEYKLEVLSRYNVAAFKGKKSVVLSTVSWVGGKNTFLGAAYVAVGAICLLLGSTFLAKHLISPRILGDQKYLVWKQ